MKPTKLIFCFTLHGFSCMQTIQVKKNVLQKEASGQGNCAVNCMCTAVTKNVSLMRFHQIKIQSCNHPAAQ